MEVRMVIEMVSKGVLDDDPAQAYPVTIVNG